MSRMELWCSPMHYILFLWNNKRNCLKICNYIQKQQYATLLSHDYHSAFQCGSHVERSAEHCTFWQTQQVIRVFRAFRKCAYSETIYMLEKYGNMLCMHEDRCCTALAADAPCWWSAELREAPCCARCRRRALGECVSTRWVGGWAGRVWERW